mmetsp:Transcript_91790/g.148204  ORF Transcript_91790/g.148204 Transcript_91790/m.148204 type:complete len:107 (+) Transcript_91790:365-685(+)
MFLCYYTVICNITLTHVWTHTRTLYIKNASFTLPDTLGIPNFPIQRTVDLSVNGAGAAHRVFAAACYYASTLNTFNSATRNILEPVKNVCWWTAQCELMAPDASGA